MTNITLNDLENLIKNKLETYMSKNEAEYLTKQTMISHLRKSPRVNPLKNTIGAMKNRENHAGVTPVYTQNKPGSLSIDFKKLDPLLYIHDIHTRAKNLAKENGIAIISFKNSAGLHTLSTRVEGLADDGYIGICSANGGPSAVIAHGGKKGVLGTNPLAYAIPTASDPILFDGATSEAPYFEIMNANRSGETLRKNIAVDKDGCPTLDAKQATYVNKKGEDPITNLTPMGSGYKGYAIVLLLEILTSVLVGSPSSDQMSSVFDPTEHGSIIICIDPSTFGSLDMFLNSIDTLSKNIKKTGDQVTLPGERGNNNLEKIKEKGSIEISEDIYKYLQG